MSIAPLITFKAGMCESSEQENPRKVQPLETPGYIYLYSDDDLIHFCWRRRDAPLDEPELDLVMVPTDGQFIPYNTSSHATAKTNGRIFVLKFASSSARHFFWLQSKPQARNGDPSWFSPRDKKIGDIVHELLQGEELDVQQELSAVQNVDNRRDDDDDDETMEDVEGHGSRSQPHTGGGGGAGPGATGGDVREEGENAREGGGDGARAATDADAAVRNFLQSIQSGSNFAGAPQQQQQGADKAFPYLNHLLPNETTIPMLRSATEDYVDSLLSFLPPAILVLATEPGDLSDVEPTAEAAAAAKASLSLAEKKSLLERVLRSPQFHQGLGSLTMAIRDGGLPSIADALQIQVADGGYIRGGGMPLGGGQAVEAFVEGVKKTVKDKKQ
ncbi:proteasome complex subunit Rpn13 ubiquitin receptor-domain-containing protein [Plectosphaerella cucumerina]|uniref:Proteasome complex subunit Rpn13 ubiquitin receptor-domain-containing protein n=1 Tax=Plectosphaerella cucumerina TaxID=40658 RepID=A0A8K0X941_9PEZI|nr:proteasome complex subunit Rpn13 ubiquitin receptor-domain-containing protein [Plectosphaerella cucumerina]